jgi:hypothetical protein
MSSWILEASILLKSNIIFILESSVKGFKILSNASSPAVMGQSSFLFQPYNLTALCMYGGKRTNPHHQNGDTSKPGYLL